MISPGSEKIRAVLPCTTSCCKGLKVRHIRIFFSVRVVCAMSERRDLVLLTKVRSVLVYFKSSDVNRRFLRHIITRSANVSSRKQIIATVCVWRLWNMLSSVVRWWRRHRCLRRRPAERRKLTQQSLNARFSPGYRSVTCCHHSRI